MSINSLDTELESVHLTVMLEGFIRTHLDNGLEFSEFEKSDVKYGFVLGLQWALLTSGTPTESVKSLTRDVLKNWDELIAKLKVEYEK